MSIEETNKIDIVATSPDGDVVKLVIADHLDWEDPKRHLLLLQAKINAYVAFIESGQINEVAPDCSRVCVAIASEYALPVIAEQFVAKAREVLSSLGVELKVEKAGAQGNAPG
jgi:Family of unknown function (DUF6572)